jgi:hypothetical protein
LPRSGSRVRIPSPAPNSLDKVEQTSRSSKRAAASTSLNKPRTVPKCPSGLGNPRAVGSRKVLSAHKPTLREAFQRLAEAPGEDAAPLFLDAVGAVAKALARFVAARRPEVRAIVVPGADDPVRCFLAACTRLTSGGRVQAAELHRAYLSWSAKSGQASMTNNMFGRRLKRLRLKRSTDTRFHYWLDLELMAPGEQPATTAGGARLGSQQRQSARTRQQHGARHE